MTLSRRELTALLPALAAANAVAQTTPAQMLPSKIYHGNQIPYEGDQKKKGRRFFYGAKRSGFNLEMHETILGPGMETHAPHKHLHEEIVMVIEGTVEAYLEGKTETAAAGSVIYFASNQMHSARNAGGTPCRYYVIELRGSEA
jgi:XRE family transcriptional regulator, regulator of sulfur utilization